MRLRASLGIIALALGGCANIPKIIRIEVDGSRIEFTKEPPDVSEPDPEAQPVGMPAAAHARRR